MPRFIAPVAVLAAAYVALVAAAALFLPHEWDWRVFAWLGSRSSPAFSSQISIVDVTWDPNDVPGNRRRLASFLDTLVARKLRPSAVILDVEFDPCQSQPCGEPMGSARDALVASIRAATASFPVFATEEPAVDRDDDAIGPVDPQDADIYGALSGAAHTRFTSIPNSTGLFYRACYAGVPSIGPSGDTVGTQSVWSMALRVLTSPRAFATAPCDTSHIPVRLGDKLAATAPAVYRFDSPATFAKDAQLDAGTYVIAGTMQFDRSPYADRSGPELLGWALSNALDQGSLAGRQAYYDAQPQNTLLFLLVPAFSALAVLAFAAAFYSLRRMRLGALRTLSPWFSSAAGALAGMASFGAFEAWMLASHHIAPQVVLVSFGIVVASGLSGVRGVQILRDESNSIDPVPNETYDYDVFISYAHQEGAWVTENVYAPFRAARLDDGSPLKIFFDRSSIRAGTGWQTTLALAIDGSRFIVPVYSDVYFTKPYCRFEIMRAHRKWIGAGDESRCVLPIMRGHPKIYATVNDIQALSIDDHPDLVRQHIDEIVARLSREKGPVA